MREPFGRMMEVAEELDKHEDPISDEYVGIDNVNTGRLADLRDEFVDLAREAGDREDGDRHFPEEWLEVICSGDKTIMWCVVKDVVMTEAGEWEPY